MNNEQFKKWFEDRKYTYDDLADKLGLDGTAIKEYVEGKSGIPEWLQYSCAFLDMKPINLEYLRLRGGHDIVERVVGANNELLASRRDKNWARVPLSEIYGETPKDVRAIYWADEAIPKRTEPSYMTKPDPKKAVKVEESVATEIKAEKGAVNKLDIEVTTKSESAGTMTVETATHVEAFDITEDIDSANDLLTDDKGVFFDPELHKTTKGGKPFKAFGKYFVEMKK